MGYISGRPHQVLLLPAKNKKLRLQYTQTNKLENRRLLAWSDKPWFLLQHSDGSVKFGINNMKDNDGYSLVLWCEGYFLVIVCPLMLSGQHHSIPETCCWLCTYAFISTVYRFCDGCYQRENVPCHKAQTVSDNQILIQQRSFGISQNRRFTSWMPSQQISSNCNGLHFILCTYSVLT